MINIPLCKKCKRPSSTGELCMDCQEKAIQSNTPHTNIKYVSEEDLEKQRMQKRLEIDQRMREDIQKEYKSHIATLFCHGPGIDAYYYLHKYDTHYMWTKSWSEQMHPIGLDGHSQDVLGPVVTPGWIRIKGSHFDKILFLREEYKDVDLPGIDKTYLSTDIQVDIEIPISDIDK